ncbi:MAG: HAMP domain-containing histidine kinase, partial [Bacteroidia bacterium]|nr:HAMP domain-containing histidine kinase [Bacteroidia bacterium]
LLAVSVKVTDNKEPASTTINIVLCFLGLLFLAVFLHLFAVYELTKIQGMWSNLILVLICGMYAGLFVSVLKEVVPEFFSSQLYGSSLPFSSLGNLLILSIIICWLSWYLYKVKNVLENIDISKTTNFTILLLILFLLGWFTQCTYQDINFNSKIPFDITNVLSSSIYTLIGLTAMGLLLATIFFISENISLVVTNKGVSTRTILVNLLLAGLIFLTIIFLIGNVTVVNIGTLIWCNIFLLTIHWIKLKDKKVRSFAGIMLLIGMAAFFSTILHIEYVNTKDIGVRKALAQNTIFDRDPVIEYLLDEARPKIEADESIKLAVVDPDIDVEKFRNYLRGSYFGGYFNRYSFELFLFDSIGDPVFGDPSFSLRKFENTILYETDTVLNEHLHHLFDASGKIKYSLKIPLVEGNQQLGHLFIEAKSKLFQGKPSFNDVLLSGNIPYKKILENYSYAIYKYCKLAYQHGEYSYSVLPNDVYSEPGSFQILSSNGFSHLVYNVNDNTLIAISKKDIPYWKILFTTFSYLFTLYSVLVLIFYLPRIFKPLIQHQSKFYLAFTERIQLTVLTIMVGLLFVIGLVTILNIYEEYNSYHEQRLKRKTKAIYAGFEYETGFDQKGKVVGSNQLSSLLKKLSSIHSLDINLFNHKGELINASQSKIYENGIITPQMNPVVLYELRDNQESYHVAQEKVGNLNYLSAYLPIRDELNEVVAYLNMPYFRNEDDLKKDISAFLITLINVYAFLFVIIGFVSLIITRQVVAPLIIIGQKFKETKLGKSNEPIEWTRNDEIGELVKEYNKMVYKLEESAQLLAKSERESAWREMAKQIAHEIKNPLTPMKLSVQHMQRSWDDKSPEIDKKFKKFTNTLIQQIDNLTTIATAFSSFAKMPTPQNKKINVEEILQSAMGLYSETANIQMNYENINVTEPLIFGDKEQVLRVFNNLLNNAVQAIPDEIDGKVDIQLRSENGQVIVQIKDDGVGIKEDQKEKIFVPNFTTKSSGTGLGLSMVKNIVENAGGKVWFESKEREGAIFYVSFPEL